MILFRLRPPKTRKHAFPIARNRNDIDKLERAVLDHLSGVLVEDDAQVAFVAKGKTFSERPGATIAILELGPNGETRVDLGTLALEAVNEFLPGGDRQVVTDR
jgi:Holliday junction resolvase RusA-like endonuclease